MANEKNESEMLALQMEKLVRHFEALRIADYMELLEKPFRLIAINFVAGLSRGFGIAIGATLIFALMLEFLRRLIMLNIPGIGGFIAELIRIVEMKNGQI
ncbi:DUF5665 domain-containing protein [Propionispora hippei]|uniref:Uncharacterized protein n=1 Tax=Propionispora hippei DSM 15287 TaxID=1123003 RepID=A0A1M6AXE6_9FIRM|nr:DUF5665 domain-containing protein [Propionispora hippei]SHI41164.1 hypothetical protein SAMN02745170_00326 [Propionispora hippei DSM 15287]